MKSQSSHHLKRSVKRRWPFDLSVYDRSPFLTNEEIRTLAAVMVMREADNKYWLTVHGNALARLLKPVDDVLDYTGVKHPSYRSGTKANLVRAMHKRGTCYWAWSSSDWIEVLGASYREFGKDCAYRQCRINLIAFCYLTSNFTDLYLLGSYSAYRLAKRVFGKHAVNSAIETVRSELRKIGYGNTAGLRESPNVLCKVILLNRSPYLKDITVEALEKVRVQYPSKISSAGTISLSHALNGIGIISKTLEQRRDVEPTRLSFLNVPPEWLDWCQRWHETSPLEPATRRGLFYCLLKTGRWLNKSKPGVSSPQVWTYELAADYVAALLRSNNGDWSGCNRWLKNKIGKPLSPWTMAHSLAAMRIFFRDCQEWGWIQRQFNPSRAFRTPPSISAKITPNPRVIADDIWAKLLWAGLNLTAEDLPQPYKRRTLAGELYFYPLEMVKALTLVWLFAGLRANEITRLRVGCIRWQREDVTIHETGEVLPKDAVCWLDVPVNKTKHAFTKPVDRAVGEAIAEWERMRPEQPPALDKKTNEMVHYLFTFRGRQVGFTYINKRLIPLLCKKAGVPEYDARGPITSHRARSTVATQLSNSKEPMSLFELQEWLGHQSPNATRYYANVNPTKLAKKYEKAGYFERNVRTIEVLIDRDAIVSGAALQGEPWQYYDLGHGWCTNAYFKECPHRMACPKCQFYVPKDSAKGQFIEGQANLQQMLQRIPLTDDERAAVEEGMELFESLCQRLADVPTPAGPTPRQLIELTRSRKDDSLQKGQIVKSLIRQS